MRAGAVGKVIASEHPGFAVGDHVYSDFGVQEYAISDGVGAFKIDPGLAPLPTYLGTLGNGVNYNNLIIAENEKNSPWTPLSVQKGFPQGENVVSVFVGFSISQGQGGIGLGVRPVPQYHQAIAYNCIPFGPLFGALIVCDPLVVTVAVASIVRFPPSKMRRLNEGC